MAPSVAWPDPLDQLQRHVAGEAVGDHDIRDPVGDAATLDVADEAEPICRQALALSEKVLGKEHPNTLSSMNNLALLLMSQGKYDEAEPIFARHWP